MQSLKALSVLVFAVLITLFVIFLLPKNIVAPSPTSESSPSSVACKIGGCSGQLCLDKDSEDFATTCEYADYYACYTSATCEVQANGKCGWTETSELKSCLANPPKLQPIEPSL